MLSRKEESSVVWVTLLQNSLVVSKRDFELLFSILGRVEIILFDDLSPGEVLMSLESLFGPQKGFKTH